MRQNAMHGLRQAFIAPVVINLAMFSAPRPAVARSSAVGADQAAGGGEDAASESLSANNGFDLTRPQTAFEARGLDETSSNDTSATNRAQMALRLEGMIPLDVGWRLGVHAQVPVVQKTTTNFDTGSADQEFWTWRRILSGGWRHPSRARRGTRRGICWGGAGALD